MARPGPAKRIAMIVANPSVSTTLGWPVGFWASELIHPYHDFSRAGCDVSIASPKGGKVDFDAYSDPRDPSGYSKDDALSLSYIGKPDFMALLAATSSIEKLDADRFDAILVAGGQSPMFTFRQDAALARMFLRFLHGGKPSAALCHGTCLLLELKDDRGFPLIRGKTMTGFANSEEDYADRAVGKKVMPFRIEDEARRLGANFIAGPAFQPHVVQDGNLITGQQQHSGHEVAKLVLAALGCTELGDGR